MREILFRGKSPIENRWIDGLLVQVGKDYSVIRKLGKDGKGYYDYIVYPYTVSQFTGLTDKNGKKIFEGDILAAPDYPNLKYKVSFANASFCVKCPAQPYLSYLGSKCSDMFGNPEYEVVGNIYDSEQEQFGNPEQLEVDE